LTGAQARRFSEECSIMAKKKRTQPTSPLENLIRAVDATVLGELVSRLAGKGPETYRECLEFLQKHVPLTAEAKADVEAEAVFTLWHQLEPDLAELNELGGGPPETEDRVADLLHRLAEKLQRSSIPTDARRGLLDEVMPYIRSRNSGMEDPLYEVAYAACRDDQDWYDFAQRLEAIGQDWPTQHARGIYRKLGDRAKYLALRSRRMQYGADYHDLATFYWEHGDREQALAVAREGLEKATGRMDELRAFVAERAKGTRAAQQSRRATGAKQRRKS
jgi:hypothetical protein